MGQSAKAVLIVSLFPLVIGAIAAWGAPQHPGAVAWVLRFVLPAAALAGVALLIRDARRPDLVPDFLTRQGLTFFERDGFCFTIIPVIIEGTCYFEMWYQNRYERACQARVVVSRGVKRIMTIPIDCEEAAYGVVRAPYAVHPNYQGTTRIFEISAAAHYPNGKGKLLRFRGGMGVGRVKMQNWSGAAAMMTLGLAGMGVIGWSRPASMKLLLPKGVAPEVPEDAPLLADTLWRLGDPVPQLVPQS